MKRTPYAVQCRTDRRNAGEDLSNEIAAGVTLARANYGVEVTAVYVVPENGNQAGDPVHGIWASVYVDLFSGPVPQAVIRWSGPDLEDSAARETDAMQQVLARAARLRRLVQAVLDGRDPGPAVDYDRVVADLAGDLQQQWSLDYCSEATAPVLEQRIALSLARRSVFSLARMRTRDGLDPLTGDAAETAAPVDENDRAALMNARSLAIGRLVALEEALNEKHNTNYATI